MKKLFYLFSTVLFLNWSSAFAGMLVEIPVEAALAPVEGYDDNDSVQVVLHGDLPNACYTLGESKVEKSNDGVISVKQYAFKEKNGICRDDQAMPEHLMMPVPFTNEVSIGVLNTGDYKLQYRLPSGKSGLRSVNVAQASTPAVDSYPYANISNVVAKEVLNSKEELTVKLTGVFNSSCTDLDEKNIRVINEKDVLVVLPVLTVKKGVCIQVMQPFERTLKLGKFATGHYLIHVRSMNGKAVNRIVQSSDS